MCVVVLDELGDGCSNVFDFHPVIADLDADSSFFHCRYIGISWWRSKVRQPEQCFENALNRGVSTR